jgi:AbiV family abortive infection protein
MLEKLMVSIHTRELKRSDIKKELKRRPSKNIIKSADDPKVLRKGADLARDNAKQFLQDAEKLIAIQSYGHAAALAMYALEECAKMLVFDALLAPNMTIFSSISRAKIFHSAMTDHEFKLAIFLYEFNQSKLTVTYTNTRLGDVGRYLQKTREAGLYVTREEYLGFTPDQTMIMKAKEQNGWMTPLDENANFPKLLIKHVGGVLEKLESIRNRTPSHAQQLLTDLMQLKTNWPNAFMRVLIEFFGEDNAKEVGPVLIESIRQEAIRKKKSDPADFFEKVPVLLIKNIMINIRA